MASPTAADTIKVVIVGDAAVGKTCMLISYTTNKFPEDYVPTIFDNFNADIKSEDGRMFALTLFDTAGQEEFDKLRTMSYNGTDIYIIACSVASKQSLENVRRKWIPELVKYSPDVPFILVGTKLDLKKDAISNEIELADSFTSLEAEKLCREYDNGIAYMECSAKTQEGLKEVFTRAINHVASSRMGSRSFRLSQRRKGGMGIGGGCHCIVS